MTPACSTKGCKNPSVHRVLQGGQVPWIQVHLCPACYQRKVWGK